MIRKPRASREPVRRSSQSLSIARSSVQEAARAAGRQLFILAAKNERDLEMAFANLIQRLNGLIVGADPLFVSRREQLVALAARSAVPAIYFGREFAEAGGLMSYGARLADAYREAGISHRQDSPG